MRQICAELSGRTKEPQMFCFLVHRAFLADREQSGPFPGALRILYTDALREAGRCITVAPLASGSSARAEVKLIDASVFTVLNATCRSRHQLYTHLTTAVSEPAQCPDQMESMTAACGLSVRFQRDLRRIEPSLNW